MSESINCPKSGEVCDNASLCAPVRVPLYRATPTIRQEIGGIRERYAEDALRRTVGETEAMLGGISLYPEFDEEGSCIVCPDEFFDRFAGGRISATTAAHGLTNMLNECIPNAVKDLRSKNRR